MLKRILDFLVRLFRRGPPKPGHFVSGEKSARGGRLAAAPLLPPAREYLLYLPRGYLGHAWSGGDASYAYNDANPPDATAMLEAFVEGRLTSEEVMEGNLGGGKLRG